MNFVTSSSTDVGLRKRVNQDSLYVCNFTTHIGNMVFAVICDGMGGYSEGEVASRSVTTAFANWKDNTLPSLLCGRIDDGIIREQWSNIVAEQNKKLRTYSAERGITTGTTVTVILITELRWYCLNVGDTRAYEITTGITQLTRDHSLLEQEMVLGRIAESSVAAPIQHNVLTQCVGISENVTPDMYFGFPKYNAIYMLCSDGFRHKVTPIEMNNAYKSAFANGCMALKDCETYLITLNKQRGETDNISVISIIIT